MDAVSLKEKGNEHFKNKEYEEAIAYYTKALDISAGNGDANDRSIYYKNRAACYLKMSKYDMAMNDCLSSLKLTPNDSKSLYRYAQALEGVGKEAESLVQLKKLLSYDSKNKEAIEMARRLMTSLKRSSERYQSTDGITKEMFQRLSDPATSVELKIQAAKNIAMLSRQEGGAEVIFRAGGVAKLSAQLGESNPAELTNHILQGLVGLVIGSIPRTQAVIEQLQLGRIGGFVSSTHTNIGMSAVGLLKEMVTSLTPAEDPILPAVVPIVQLMLLSLLRREVSSDTRDGIMEFFAKTIPLPHMVKVYIEEKLVGQILLLSTHTWVEMDAENTEEEEDRIAFSNDCRINASMVLSTLHKSIQEKKDESLNDSFKQQCKSFIESRIKLKDMIDHMGTLSSIACLLQGVVEIGNEIFSEEAVLQLCLTMADSPDITCQGMAAEVLALAASDKTRCQGLMDKGLPVLKTLYHSSDNRVQVKALVGLCKLGASSGGNVNARPFAEGATLKLEKICRKYLVSSKKGEDLRKWAAEGIAFLSLDAEVKEALIQDEKAIKALCNLVNSPDKSLLYGIASTFVNLTNSYDKPERNPELEELGKYAGEQLPKEHEMDGEDYVKKRVDTLLRMSIIVSLNELASSPSKVIREQVSRTFLALTENVKNRGKVIQQGGVKSLISLALDNNTDKGKLIASQSLAKIGITNNPQLAFPGQRMLEVVRPLVQLLKSQNGLHQFEGLMALTNLASMDDDVRQRINREGAVRLMEGLMFEEEEMIRRAATEALCNMIQLDEVHQRFYGDDLERVKLWTLFSGEDDEALARAASGGLAQLSHDPKICQQIMDVKSATEILKELITKENEELRFRGMYILANLIDSTKEIAEKLIKDEFLELLMVFLQGDYPDNIKNQAERAIKKAAEYGLIKPNPDIMKE
jgi:Tfp pilus assembly protein PilF